MPSQFTHVHLTNHQTWDPKDATLPHLEQELRATVAPVRGPDIGVSDEDFIDLPAYGLSAFDKMDEPCPVFDIRSVAAVGTIQDMEAIRASCALDVDSYAAALSEGRFVEEAIDDLHPDRQFVEADDRFLSASYISKKKSALTAEVLAKRWKCGKEAAQRTIDNTTQLAIRDTSNVSGDRRLRPYSNILRYPKLFCSVFVDILHGKCTSLDGNKYCAVMRLISLGAMLTPSRKRAWSITHWMIYSRRLECL